MSAVSTAVLMAPSGNAEVDLSTQVMAHKSAYHPAFPQGSLRMKGAPRKRLPSASRNSYAPSYITSMSKAHLLSFQNLWSLYSSEMPGTQPSF